jgi:uncharacterized protein YdeI (YjbR/CyaY-like superfamily)
MSSDDWLLLPDQAAWRSWLDEHEDAEDAVWLVLAKKGVTTPTSLTYSEALDEALCSGWIDGQRKSNDATTFLQRFTPRRRKSVWSLRNTEHIERLGAEGRLRPRGVAEVQAAKDDGRWERAYSGPATMEDPEDLLMALAAAPAALAAYRALNRQERFLEVFPIVTATTARTRAARIARAVERLEG